jgi:hypothetical protein
MSSRLWEEASADLDINERPELLNVLVESLCLPPASFSQVSILIHNTNVMKTLPMPDKMHHLHPNPQAERKIISLLPIRDNCT